MNDAATCPAPGDRSADLAQRERLIQLLAASAQGDQSAFASLYDEVSPVVHGIAVRVLRNPALAAELTQEVMVEIWRTADRFDRRRGSVFAWAATMAHRRAIDRVRSEESRVAREQRDHQLDAAHAVGAAPEEQMLEALDASRVRQCLGRLTELEREAVSAAYYGGQSYSEVAQALGAKLATVKSRIRSGLERLRLCLGVS